MSAQALEVGGDGGAGAGLAAPKSSPKQDATKPMDNLSTSSPTSKEADSPSNPAEAPSPSTVASSSGLASKESAVSGKEGPKPDDEDHSLVPRFFGADDMPEEMKQVAVEVARAAIKKKTNKDRAEHIKKYFDKTYGGSSSSGGKWHCIVGTDFGSYVTHESSNFVFFQLGAFFILIFKA